MIKSDVTLLSIPVYQILLPLTCPFSSTKKVTGAAITQAFVRTRRQIKYGHSQNVQLLEMGNKNDVIAFSIFDTRLIL